MSENTKQAQAKLMDAVWAFLCVLERHPFTGYEDIRKDYGIAETKALLKALVSAMP